VSVCLLLKSPTHSLFCVGLSGGFRWTFTPKVQRKIQDALVFWEDAERKKENALENLAAVPHR